MRTLSMFFIFVLLVVFSCSLKEVTDKDLELGKKNVQILDDLEMIDKQEDTAVKKVIGVDEKYKTPESKEKKELKQKVETFKGEIEKINEDMNNLRLELVMKEERIKALKDSLESVKEKYAGEPKRKEVSEEYSYLSYADRYKIALSEFRNRNYRKAMLIFKELLEEDTENKLADNCQYWIGECYYGLKQYEKALIEFEKVLTYGQSNKDDDSQIKIGLCYIQLGDMEKAKEELNRLMVNYPTSEYIHRAKRLIAKMPGK